MSKLAVLSGQADVELGGTSTGERWWTCRKFSGTTIIAYMVPYTNHVNTLSGSRYMVMCHYVSENRRENMQRNHVAIFRQIGGSASLPPPTPACRDEKHSIDLLVAFPTRAQRISDVSCRNKDVCIKIPKYTPQNLVLAVVFKDCFSCMKLSGPLYTRTRRSACRRCL